MATQKTLPTNSSVTAFLDSVTDEKKRADSYAALQLMQEVTGYPAVMWGPGIVGFGSYHYKYASGHEGDAPLTGFSPRKNALTFYVLPGMGTQEALLEKLGKYKAGKGCLYVKQLEDIDTGVLRELIRNCVDTLQAMYPARQG
ncbi:DUF1801 domain-containing protein [Chitinophaga japonensis]|uniref:Uncharacterized protein DUF1801 n=1 Tax=Chitinophaga japonensis TaxID=104662 RepID=A0A562T910_CHIJA|nr:DUF1801 domain-containing protein [Chitinophaga japonensis]TWI89300.1 uncharacterized protein DUF1801 [Chitinophaga japonensis]